MKTVQIYGRENIPYVRSYDIEFGDQFHLTLGPLGIDAQLARRDYEILLQNLERDDAASIAPVFDEEFAGAPLLEKVGIVIDVDENIRVEEATSAHEFRRG